MLLELPLSTVDPDTAAAGLRWFDCEATPALPVDVAGRPDDRPSRPGVLPDAWPWIPVPGVVALFLTAVF